MSIESAKAYIERMDYDMDFQKRVLNCKNPEERIRFVRAEGFDFTAEDLKNLKSKLTDSEVKNVAGGKKDLKELMIKYLTIQNEPERKILDKCSNKFVPETEPVG